jgi:hypothetical protein
MDFCELEPEIRRYVRKSTFEGMSYNEQEVYVKGIRRIVRKLSELDNRESYVEISSKSSDPRPSLKFTAVGMRYRGNYDFSYNDNITLELDDDNHVDKYAIKILVDGKHVAFVAAEDARKLRAIDGLLDRSVYVVKKFNQSVMMTLGDLPKSPKKDPGEHELPSQVTDKHWVYARRTGEMSMPSNSGKWMLFYDKSVIDDKWLQVKDLLEQGKLGDSAKCSTAMPNSNASGPKKVIIVYTADYTDTKDVYRVAKTLHKKLQYEETMYYKTDEQTHAGLYATSGSRKNHMYRYPS